VKKQVALTSADRERIRDEVRTGRLFNAASLAAVWGLYPNMAADVWAAYRKPRTSTPLQPII